MTISKRLSAALVVAVIAILFGFVSIAFASHSWGGYHWARTANPFTLQLGDNVTSTWDSYLDTTSGDWSLSTVLDTTVVAGTAGKNCRAAAGRAEVCNAKYGRNGWLGIASIWVNGSHITQGTVKLNDTYFNTAAYNKPEWRNLVMCQEVGHIFGLDHQDETFGNTNLGTCMDYTNDPSTNQHPNAHDYEELELIYAHLDTTTTLSQTTAATARATDEDSNDPRTWGREVRRSADGRSSMFEQDLGGGQTIIRHVFWAEPQSRADRAR